MKKVISLALAAVICSASMLLAACGGSTTKTIATVDDLEGAKIGVQLGTTGDIYASDYEEKGSTVERFNKGADAVLALTQGKIDCVIIDSEPAKAFVAANDGLKILDEPFAEEEYAICVAKDNTDLLGKINTALAELKADGTTESIEKNFIGDDTKGKTPYVTPASFMYLSVSLSTISSIVFPDSSTVSSKYLDPVHISSQTIAAPEDSIMWCSFQFGIDSGVPVSISLVAPFL